MADKRPADRGTGAVGEIRVRDVVRDVVAEVAAEELPLVDGMAALDDATVVRRLRGHGRRGPLGFGLGEVAMLVIPVVWLAVDQAAKRIGNVAADSATRGAKVLLGKIFRRRSAPATIPPLSQEQLAEVHWQVVASAMRRGMAEKRATTIADAVVARLAMKRPEDMRKVAESAAGRPTTQSDTATAGPDSPDKNGTPARAEGSPGLDASDQD